MQGGTERKSASGNPTQQEDTQTEVAQHLIEQKLQHEERIFELKEELKIAKKQLSQYANDIENLHIQIHGLQTQNNDLHWKELQVAERDETIRVLENSTYEDRIEDLQALADAYRQTRDQLESENVSLKEELESYRRAASCKVTEQPTIARGDIDNNVLEISVPLSTADRASAADVALYQHNDCCTETVPSDTQGFHTGDKSEEESHEQLRTNLEAERQKSAELEKQIEQLEQELRNQKEDIASPEQKNEFATPQTKHTGIRLTSPYTTPEGKAHVRERARAKVQQLTKMLSTSKYNDKTPSKNRGMTPDEYCENQAPEQPICDILESFRQAMDQVLQQKSPDAVSKAQDSLEQSLKDVALGRDVNWAVIGNVLNSFEKLTDIVCTGDSETKADAPSCSKNNENEHSHLRLLLQEQEESLRTKDNQIFRHKEELSTAREQLGEYENTVQQLEDDKKELHEELRTKQSEQENLQDGLSLVNQQQESYEGTDQNLKPLILNHIDALAGGMRGTSNALTKIRKAQQALDHSMNREFEELSQWFVKIIYRIRSHYVSKRDYDQVYEELASLKERNIDDSNQHVASRENKIEELRQKLYECEQRNEQYKEALKFAQDVTTSTKEELKSKLEGTKELFSRKMQEQQTKFQQKLDKVKKKQKQLYEKGYSDGMQDPRSSSTLSTEVNLRKDYDSHLEEAKAEIWEEAERWMATEKDNLWKQLKESKLRIHSLENELDVARSKQAQGGAEEFHHQWEGVVEDYKRREETRVQDLLENMEEEYKENVHNATERARRETEQRMRAEHAHAISEGVKQSVDELKAKFDSAMTENQKKIKEDEKKKWEDWYKIKVDEMKQFYAEQEKAVHGDQTELFMGTTGFASQGSDSFRNRIDAVTDSLKKRINEKHRELEEKDAQLHYCRTELEKESQRSALFEEQLENLQRKHEQIRGRLDRREEELRSAHEKEHHLRSNIEQLQESLRTAQDDLRTCKGEHQKREEKLLKEYEDCSSTLQQLRLNLMENECADSSASEEVWKTFDRIKDQIKTGTIGPELQNKFFNDILLLGKQLKALTDQHKQELAKKVSEAQEAEQKHNEEAIQQLQQSWEAHVQERLKEEKRSLETEWENIAEKKVHDATEKQEKELLDWAESQRRAAVEEAVNNCKQQMREEKEKDISDAVSKAREEERESGKTDIEIAVTQAIENTQQQYEKWVDEEKENAVSEYINYIRDTSRLTRSSGIECQVVNGENGGEDRGLRTLEMLISCFPSSLRSVVVEAYVDFCKTNEIEVESTDGLTEQEHQMPQSVAWEWENLIDSVTDEAGNQALLALERYESVAQQLGLLIESITSMYRSQWKTHIVGYDLEASSEDDQQLRGVAQEISSYLNTIHVFEEKQHNSIEALQEILAEFTDDEPKFDNLEEIVPMLSRCVHESRNQYEERIKEAQEEIDSVAAQLRSAHEERESLETDCANQKHKAEELRSRVDRLNTVIQEKDERINELKERLDTLSESLSSRNESNQQEVHRKAEELDRLKTESTQKITEMERKLATERSEHERKLKQVIDEERAREKENIERACSELKNAHLEEIQRMQENHTREEHYLQEQLKEEQLRIKELEDKLAADIERIYQESYAKVEDLQRELKQEKEEAEDLKRKLEHAEQIARDISNEKKSVEQKYNSLSSLYWNHERRNAETQSVPEEDMNNPELPLDRSYSRRRSVDLVRSEKQAGETKKASSESMRNNKTGRRYSVGQLMHQGSDSGDASIYMHKIRRLTRQLMEQEAQIFLLRSMIDPDNNSTRYTEETVRGISQNFSLRSHNDSIPYHEQSKSVLPKDEVNNQPSSFACHGRQWEDDAITNNMRDTGKTDEILVHGRNFNFEGDASAAVANEYPEDRNHPSAGNSQLDDRSRMELKRTTQFDSWTKETTLGFANDDTFEGQQNYETHWKHDNIRGGEILSEASHHQLSDMPKYSETLTQHSQEYHERVHLTSSQRVFENTEMVEHEETEDFLPDESRHEGIGTFHENTQNWDTGPLSKADTAEVADEKENVGSGTFSQMHSNDVLAAPSSTSPYGNGQEDAIKYNSAVDSRRRASTVSDASGFFSEKNEEHEGDAAHALSSTDEQNIDHEMSEPPQPSSHEHEPQEHHQNYAAEGQDDWSGGANNIDVSDKIPQAGIFVNEFYYIDGEGAHYRVNCNQWEYVPVVERVSGKAVERLLEEYWRECQRDDGQIEELHEDGWDFGTSEPLTGAVHEPHDAQQGDLLPIEPEGTEVYSSEVEHNATDVLGIPPEGIFIDDEYFIDGVGSHYCLDDNDEWMPVPQNERIDDNQLQALLEEFWKQNEQDQGVSSEVPMGYSNDGKGETSHCPSGSYATTEQVEQHGNEANDTGNYESSLHIDGGKDGSSVPLTEVNDVTSYPLQNQGGCYEGQVTRHQNELDVGEEIIHSTKDNSVGNSFPESSKEPDDSSRQEQLENTVGESVDSSLRNPDEDVAAYNVQEKGQTNIPEEVVVPPEGVEVADDYFVDGAGDHWRFDPNAEEWEAVPEEEQVSEERLIDAILQANGGTMVEGDKTTPFSDVRINTRDTMHGSNLDESPATSQTFAQPQPVFFSMPSATSTHSEERNQETNKTTAASEDEEYWEMARKQMKEKLEEQKQKKSTSAPPTPESKSQGMRSIGGLFSSWFGRTQGQESQPPVDDNDDDGLDPDAPPPVLPPPGSDSGANGPPSKNLFSLTSHAGNSRKNKGKRIPRYAPAPYTQQG